MSLTIIVPFYNEEKNIKQSVTNLIQASVGDVIYLVDDCSTDRSLKIANELVKENKKLLLFQKKLNEGKGSCVKHVINEINTSHVIVHDADLEQNPYDIKDLINLSMENPEALILGSRIIGKIKRVKHYSFLTIANYILALLFSFVNFYRISDISSGYLLYPTKFLKSISLKEKGFGLEVEILSKFLKFNREIYEVPISYTGRKYSEGKKIKLKDGLNILFKIIKYRFTN